MGGGLGPSGPRHAREPVLRVREVNAVSTLLVIVLLLLLIGALPAWPYSSGWGFYPSGGFGLILLVILVLLFTGRL